MNLLNSQESKYKEIEVGLLGSILIAADECLEEVVLELKPDDFLSAEGKRIFETILALYNEGVYVDTYTVKNRAGKAYNGLIDGIVIATPSGANWRAYLHELKRLSKLKKTAEWARRIYNDSLSPAADIDTVRHEAEELLTTIENSDARKIEFDISQLSVDFIKNIDKPKEYLDWGMGTLNKAMLCERGDYALIGATPSVGKTAIALQIAIDMAKKGLRIVFFSCETASKKIMERVYSCQSRVSYDAIRRRILNDRQKSDLYNTAKWLSKLQFTVIESAGFTVEDIRAKAIKLKADVIFIDYIQLVCHRNEKLTEYARVTEVSRGIQQMCQKYKITTIALSQFGRLQDGRKPTLSNFRSSGQLEQDINFGILFYRPEDIQEGEEDNKRIFEIAKNKDGKLAKIRMNFEGDFQTFTVVDDLR